MNKFRVRLQLDEVQLVVSGEARLEGPAENGSTARKDRVANRVRHAWLI